MNSPLLWTVLRLVALPAIASAVLLAAADRADAIRRAAAQGNVAEALREAGAWVEAEPDNREALTWRARVLTWSGRLTEAERDFRALLVAAPENPEILEGLAAALNAGGRHAEALQLLERACPDATASPECGAARARTLRWAGRSSDARRLFAELHLRDETPPEEKRYRLQFGGGADLMDRSNALGLWSASFSARLSRLWQVEGGVVGRHRFGQLATGGEAKITLRVGPKTAIWIGGESSGTTDVGPRAMALFGIDHGLETRAGPVRAVELIWEQRSAWYSGVQVRSFTPGALLYLRRGVDLLLQSTISEMRVSQPDWHASVLARVSFPLVKRLRGRILTASGAENFGSAEQLLFRSSRTLGAGLALSTASGAEFQAGIRYQRTSGGRSLTGYEGAYGIRF